MPSLMTGHNPASSRQHGAVLIVALMFLIVLTLLGLSAMTGTTLEERMAGNNRDYNMALQAAEATMRDAEADLKNSGVTVGRTVNIFSFPAAAGCNTQGLCYTATETNQQYGSVNWSSTATTPYGTYTQTPASATATFPGVSQQPRYMMELVQFADGKNKARVTGASTSVDAYYIRITARAWGANPSTVVTLQEVFVIPL
jgi:type IV pilus assembly protein PilX